MTNERICDFLRPFSIFMLFITTMNSIKNHREEIVKALILCANAYLEMDMDSSDEDIEAYLVEDDVDIPSKNIINGPAALSVPKWNADEYKVNLKISSETFDFVYRLLAPRLRRQCHGMPMVDARLQIMVALHKLTSFNTYRDASATFNMKKSTGYCCTNRVINALYMLAPAFIKWPSKPEEAAKEFEEFSGFPGVVGNIGLCRLQMLEFLERDSKDGLLLQVICDSKQKIIHCDIRQPNTDLIQDTDLAKYLRHPTKFPINTHLIANKSYPLHENIMIPYEDNNDIQRNFNKKIQAAFVVDKCIGSLMSRFESLKRGLTLNEKANKRHVIACCVLHNICLLKNDFCDGIADLEQGACPDSFPEGVQKRDAIACELPMG